MADKMTKAQMQENGRVAGLAAYRALGAYERERALSDLERDDMRNFAGLSCSVFAASNGLSKAAVVFDAMVAAFLSVRLDDYRAQPHVRDAERSQRFQWRLRSDVDGAEDALTRFAGRLEKDPASAFEWGTDAVEAAAKLKVARTVQLVVAEHGLDVAGQVARQETLRRARSTSRSTSPMSNLVEDGLRAAWAEWAERLHQEKE
jgi:hypothetical protein